MANTKVQSEQIEDGAITAAKIADGAIVASEVADNAITTAKINADAVTGAKIADNAIDSEHYTDGSIDTAHIADAQITVGKMAANSVDSDQYVDGSIDTVHIADAQVTTAKITDGNISTAKIADNAVTSAKIDTNIDIAGTFDVTGATTLDSTLAVAGDANFDSGTLFVDVSSNNVGIGTTSPSTGFNANRNNLVISDASAVGLTLNSTATDGSSIISMTDGTGTLAGEIHYVHDGDYMQFKTANAERMRIASSGQIGIGGANYGTSGQVLTSGGSGSAPSWADAGGGGAYSFISTTTISGTSTSSVQFTNLSSDFDVFFIDAVVWAQSTTTQFRIRFMTDSSTSVSTAYYDSRTGKNGGAYSKVAAAQELSLIHISEPTRPY